MGMRRSSAESLYFLRVGRDGERVRFTERV
jgi:hypothetical protein